MPVKIVGHEFAEREQVGFDAITATIEKNRDRVRTVAGMLLSLSGILISFSAGFVIFVADKATKDHRTIAIFIGAVLAFLVSAALAISSSFLRSEYAISDRAQFTTDLLALYNSELRLLRIGCLVVILGMLLILAGVGSFIVKRW
jgi:hypothetical protein